MALALIAASAFVLASCGRNEPGTMGGEPAVPETVATGAPAQAAKETSTTDADQRAPNSEHASSTFDDAASTNVNSTTRPDASTRSR